MKKTAATGGGIETEGARLRRTIGDFLNRLQEAVAVENVSALANVLDPSMAGSAMSRVRRAQQIFPRKFIQAVRTKFPSFLEELLELQQQIQAYRRKDKDPPPAEIHVSPNLMIIPVNQPAPTPLASGVILLFGDEAAPGIALAPFPFNGVFEFKPTNSRWSLHISDLGSYILRVTVCNEEKVICEGQVCRKLTGGEDRGEGFYWLPIHRT